MNPIEFLEKNKRKPQVILAKKGKSLELQLLDECGIRNSTLLPYRVRGKTRQFPEMGVSKLLATYTDEGKHYSINSVRKDFKAINIGWRLVYFGSLTVGLVAPMINYALGNSICPFDNNPVIHLSIFGGVSFFGGLISSGMVYDSGEGRKYFNKLKESARAIDDYLDEKRKFENYVLSSNKRIDAKKKYFDYYVGVISATKKEASND